MASLLDLITDTRNAARPNSAKVASSRTAGAATLACDNLSGWPTASKVHFVTYQIDSSSNPVAGTQLDCVGIVSGNSLTSLTVKDGTDSGNAINDVVEMLPTAAWGQDLATALTTEHDRTGKHTNITATSLTNTGNSTIGGNQTIAGALSVTGASTHTGASTFTGAIGGAGYSLATMFNPYKFSVYRTAAFTAPGTSSSAYPFDTRNYDTGSNVDISTNKGRFTAPIAGFYHFSATVGWSTPGSSGVFYGVALMKNGTVVYPGEGEALGFAGATTPYRHVSGEIQLAANDYVEVSINSNGVATQVGTQGSIFTGSLVSAT